MDVEKMMKFKAKTENVTENYKAPKQIVKLLQLPDQCYTMTGPSLERVPWVPRHPLKFDNGCLAPILIIFLGFEHFKNHIKKT